MAEEIFTPGVGKKACSASREQLLAKMDKLAASTAEISALKDEYKNLAESSITTLRILKELCETQQELIIRMTDVLNQEESK